MDKKIRVSVIVPVYNVEKYLSQCVDSVLNQTYKDFELILVDDGSLDNCPQICDEYAQRDARIKVIHKPNGGVSSARNEGLKSANGEFVVFVDSDDWIANDCLGKMIKRQSETNADLVFCNFCRVENERTIVVEKDYSSELTVDFTSKQFITWYKRFFIQKNNFISSCWRTLFKRTLVENATFNGGIKISEDMVFLLWVINNAKRLAFIDKPLYFYRVNPSSALHSYKKDFLESDIILYNELQKIRNNIAASSLDKVFTSYYGNRVCYGLFSNEIKYNRSGKKEKIAQIKKSELYQYFTIKNGLKIGVMKETVKYFIVYLIVKLHLY